MRKIYTLVFASMFALTGCASKITVAEAKTKANEIREHEIADEDVKELKASQKSKVQVKTEGSVVNLDLNVEAEMVYEISASKNYVHYIQKASGTLYDTDQEGWMYVKDNVFYQAMRTVDDGVEKLEYSKVEGDAASVEAFNKTLEYGIKSVKESIKAASDEGLAIVDELPEEGESKVELYEGIEVDAKLGAYSSGEGSLIVKGNFVMNDFNGVNGKASGSYSVSWDKYMISECTAKFNFSGKDGDKTATVKVEQEEKLSHSFRASYPDLSKYTEK